MKGGILLLIFCKLNGYRIEESDMVTLFGSAQHLIILHRRKK